MSEEKHKEIIKELENKYLGKCLILKDSTTTDEIIDVVVDYREETQHMNRVNDGSKTICTNEILCTTEEVLKIFKENRHLKEILKGTTHCFDEKEHQRLIEENKELKKHLVTPKNITLKTLENYKSYYDDIEKDNILNDTYIDYCAYLNTLHILTEFEKWLDEEIKRISKLIDPKKSIKPYGEELHLLETARNGYIYAKEELQELKEGKKK